MPRSKENPRKTFTVNGKRYDISAKSAKELEKKVIEKKVELAKGEVVFSQNTTVSKWAMEWLEVYKKPRIGNKNYKTYLTNINNHILPKIGDMKLKDVKAVDLQRILNEHEGESFSHVGKIRNTLKAMFLRAKRNHLISYDPAEDIELPDVTNGTHRSITEDERSLLLKVCETHYAGLWALVLLYTGIRPQESSPLLWKDIDIKKGILHINKALESGSSTNVKSTKTSAGNRDIPIPEPLLTRLTLAYPANNPNGLVFKTSLGSMPDKVRCDDWWKNIKREMDIEAGATVYRNEIIKSKLAPDLVLYCLRHTFCTDLQRAGVPINVAKYLMGHADIATTANIYTDNTSDVTEAARVSLNKLHSKGSVEMSPETINAPPCVEPSAVLTSL